MAEDETDQEFVDDVEEEEEDEQRISDCQNRGKPCNRRIDELALPSKRLLLNTFKQYGYLFPETWNERIKELLSILYAMTPQETEKYFEQLRKMSRQNALRKKRQKRMKNFVKLRKEGEMRLKANALFTNIIKVGLTHAATQNIPPLVSVRMRYLSDIILQHLADIRNVPTPDRKNPDELGTFLLSAADWIAISVINVYYLVQLRKNEELEQIEEIEMSKIQKEREERKREKHFHKGVKNASTPNQSNTNI